MPNKILITVLMLVATIAGLVVPAVAAPVRVSGAIELRYGSHTATENGSQVLDASHFTQKYSFLAEKQGQLANGRLGEYDLALGYEWSWVDSTRGNGVDIDIKNPLDKLLYRGEINISPGGLPFNVRAFSYDMRSTTLIEEELGEIFRSRGYTASGGTVTNIQNGSNRVTGLTLQVGEKNGHYEGKYRDILATVPRLLLDFRQQEVSDLKSLSPRDYVDRDLAFVSLNKKDNWFHYKVFTHEDRIDSRNNFREQSFLLGTIDHRERRQWINLTNWIKVSADISYSESLPETTSSGVSSAGVLYQKRYDINLFAKARRTRWQGSNFTTYSRVNDGFSLDRSLYVPLFARGELNRDTAWRISMASNSTESDIFGVGADLQTHDLYATARVDTFRQARYIFSPMVAAESKQGFNGDGYAVSAGAEFRNNSAYRSIYDLFGHYEARWFTGTGDAGRNVDYLEQLGEGRIERDINSQLRVGLEQRLLLANGTFDATVADNISADSATIINYSSTDFEGTVFRSLTTLTADYRSLSRVNNRIGLMFDYQSSPALSGQQLMFSHNLDYYKGAWSVAVSNVFAVGDELATTATSLGRGIENYFTNIMRLSYRPSRTVKASLQGGYEWRSFTSGSDIERYLVKGLSEYTLWKVNGLIRKLAVFGQEIELLKSLEDSAAIGDNYTAFTLFTNYYPTRISLLTARLRYEIDDISVNDTLIAYLSAGLDFQKLKVSLDYSYGDRSRGETQAERTEHRWEVKVTKLF